MQPTHPDDLRLLAEKWRLPFSRLEKPYFSLDLSEIEIQWNGRMRSRAGVCKPVNNLIQLNPHVLKDIKSLEQVFIHELCHMVISRRWPYARSHGVKWRGLMIKMGFEPTRCHELPFVRRHLHRRWPAFCSCRTHQISTRVHNKIKRGIRYKCVDCEGRLIASA